MTEPILTREEMKAIYSQHFANPYDLLPDHAQAFAAAIEAAVLEKVCGEPVKWQARIPGSTWFDVKPDLIDRMRDEGADVRPLYDLHRSKP
jgi:hypothetical protein